MHIINVLLKSNSLLPWVHDTNQYVYGTCIGGIPALKQKSDWQQIADILICDIPNVVAFIHNKLWYILQINNIFASSKMFG